MSKHAFRGAFLSKWFCAELDERGGYTVVPADKGWKSIPVRSQAVECIFVPAKSICGAPLCKQRPRQVFRVQCRRRIIPRRPIDLRKEFVLCESEMSLR